MGEFKMFGWIVAFIVAGYAIGCLHGSVVAQKISGVNIKETGLKNAGASNATIVLGKKFGALVAAIDIGKGVVAVLAVRIVATSAGLPDDAIALLLFVTGAAAVLGHNFPYYMNFNGGKGTATVIGVLLAIDWRFGLIGLALLIIVAIISDYLVFGVLMLYGSFIAAALWAPGSWPVAIAIVLFAMALWKHIENFRHIKDRSEKRVSSVLKRK